jgi:hypothetical protein
MGTHEVDWAWLLDAFATCKEVEEGFSFSFFFFLSCGPFLFGWMLGRPCLDLTKKQLN